jgi:hypothetical protein
VYGSIQSTVILPHCIVFLSSRALKQNRLLLIEFIPAASPPPSLFTSVSTLVHGHIQHITTPSPDAISSKHVFNALKQSVLLNFGDVDWGEVGASLAGERFLFPPPSLFPSVSIFLFFFFFPPFCVDAEQSKVFLPHDKPLHRTCRTRHCDKHDLGSTRVAGQSGRRWRWQ